ncbi:YqaE/Pmp3 family membrane protein [Crocinitomix algicola]|uniref:YqaE/Pmp3 family membrane protein n=1 Tax=Crocinitomix algicola TaxID=1740263 RepID=UPI00082BB3AD|nr:YqaE/Pmp3 family membrane protein [Crocinitomix algicola]
MKKFFLKGAIALLSVVTMLSCSTSNEVAGKRGIQKRKYTKGYFFDFKKNYGNSTSEDDLADTRKLRETSIEEIQGFIESQTLNDQVLDKVEEVVSVNNLTPEYATNTAAVENLNSSFSDENEKNNFQKASILKEDLKEIKKDLKSKKKQFRHKKVVAQSSDTSDDEILYYILAIVIPFLAVGLVTDWDISQVIINILLCCLCGLPGIIHALIVVSKNV